MKRQRRTKAGAGIVTIMLAVLLCMPLVALAGSLEPTAPPGPTMKTLDEIPPIWSQKRPAAQRFVIVLDGAAVLDKETGLVWEKSPDTTTRAWDNGTSDDAVYYCYNKTVGGRKGWRLPTVEELASLIDTTQNSPALPSGHPFLNVRSGYYWSSTQYPGNAVYIWAVDMGYGYTDHINQTYSGGYVWLVRGRQ